MTPAERDLVMDRILAAWPRPKLADKALLLWHEHLGPLDIVRALDAVKALEATKPTRPAMSDFHAAYGPTAPKATSTQAPACGICDNGFVEVAAGIIPTVTRCPQGCMPMTAEQRQAHDHHERRLWEQHRARPGASARNFSEPDREDVELDF